MQILTTTQRPVLLGVQGAKIGCTYERLAVPAKELMFLQAGIKLNSLHSKEVSHALKKATTDR